MLTHARYEGLLDIGWNLAGITDERALTAASTQLVQQWAGVDAVGFSSIHHAHGEITAIGLSIFPAPSEENRITCARLKSALVTDHPIAEHFLRRPRPVPVRLSDIMQPDRFRATFTYAVLFEPRGLRYQITLPIRLSPKSSVTYGINRSDVDFTDEELQQACVLQATLSAIHAAAAAHVARQHLQETSVTRLTAREQDILELMASGMTAVAMGRARRISPRTVHKHLENVYTKLDVHDRLEAVNRARQVGLLPR